MKYKHILLSILWVLFLFVSLSSASATTEIISENTTGWASVGASSYIEGSMIRAHQNTTLIRVETYSSTTCGWVELLDSSCNSLDNQTVTNNNATFNYNLIAGTLYILAAHNGGASCAHYGSGAGGEDYGQQASFNSSAGKYGIVQPYGSLGSCTNDVGEYDIVAFEVDDNVGPGSTPSIAFQGQTPSNNTHHYYNVTNFFTMNTTATNFGGTVNTTQYLYNESGVLISNYTQTTDNMTMRFNFTPADLGQRFYFNASATNGSVTNQTDTRTVIVYYITAQIPPRPDNNTQETRYHNATWRNATFTPSDSSLSIVNFTLALNSCGFSTVCSGSTQSGNWTTVYNYTNIDYYGLNLTPMEYYQYEVFAWDDIGNADSSATGVFNVTRNMWLNVSAITVMDNASVENFSGWVYNHDYEINVTFNTTNGSGLADTIRGNITIHIDAPNYALDEDVTTVNMYADAAVYNYTFYLYEMNTLNITFYDEETLTILNTTTVYLDLISDLFSGNYSTNNGTLYLSLLTPESYTMRYWATGYTTRFYTVTISNRSFQNLDLYLVNDTIYSNVTVYVVDEVTDPVEGAIVEALKYDLASNTYILQEMGVTDISGATIMTLTMYDEYYRFIVEYDGETMKTTSPSYIDDDEIIIQISFADEIGTEYFDYETIDYTFEFNNETDNFRFVWNDVNGISSQFCVYVYEGSNFSTTLFNSSCTSGASGTILLGVTPVNGTTYYGKAYYTEAGWNKYLAGAQYTYPDDDIFGTLGLFLQVIITLAFIAVAFASPPLAAILAPFSLILGSLLGLTTLTMYGLVPLQVVGIILAIVLSVRK